MRKDLLAPACVIGTTFIGMGLDKVMDCQGLGMVGFGFGLTVCVMIYYLHGL